jgi:hypothetical protein
VTGIFRVDVEGNDVTKDLVSKVKKWLEEESGYPLEMTTAAALASAGFEVVQGDYFPDAKSGVLRELDVTGYIAHSDAGVQISVALLVECKSSVEKPWLLFTSAASYPPNLAIVRRSTNERGQKLLNKLQFDVSAQNSPLFQLPSRCGYALSVAMRKAGDKDPAYDALMGVCTASLGHIKRLEDVVYPKIVPFDWPVIVIKAPLLECYLDSNGAAEVKEIEKGTLIWRNPILHRHTIVNVYRESAFKAEVQSLQKAASEFSVLARKTVDILAQGQQGK